MPASSPRPSQADLESCRAALRGGSRSFFAASLLLPRRVSDPATALYAFCRLADDSIDGPGGSGDGIEALYRRLDCAYRGCPLPAAADRALAFVVARHAIPFALPAALLEGFAWDAAGRRYRTLAELEDYAARVAGTVGAMMAMLMGVRDRDTVARACDLGIAMQLSNIARDVGEDGRAGRLYLPLDWMREAGLDEDAWLKNPVFGDGLASVIRRLLAAADTLYARADGGIGRLPLACRPGIGAARLLYAEIGREVARMGCDSVTRRAVVPPARKAVLVARSCAAALQPARMALHPPLPASRFLVEAVANAPTRPPSPRRRRWQALEERGVWLIDLFARLEQRAQAERGGS